MKLQIEYVPKGSLKAYARNAKIHTERQIAQIKASIREFGFNDPIAVWKDNEIIEGHGRLIAAMEMDEITEVPIIRLDSLTDAQRKAYGIAHNKLTMNTDFDLDMLALEIKELTDEFELDMTDFGFNEAEILDLTVFNFPEETPAPTPQPQQTEDHRAEVEREYGGESVPKEDLDYYQEKAETVLNKRVIIMFRTDEDEMALKRLLRLPENEPLSVIYDIKNLHLNDE